MHASTWESIYIVQFIKSKPHRHRPRLAQQNSDITESKRAVAQRNLLNYNIAIVSVCRWDFPYNFLDRIYDRWKSNPELKKIGTQNFENPKQKMNIITKQRHIDYADSYARIRSADLNIVASRGDEGANQGSKAWRVDAVVVGDQDRRNVAVFHFWSKNLKRRERESSNWFELWESDEESCYLTYFSLTQKKKKRIVIPWRNGFGTNGRVLRTQGKIYVYSTSGFF